ncbi:M23 family metallopeptidase [Gracilibacillus salinarum]|uniref:Peptidoglycan DD-metalloendopeptidase family protein n=1 Tax=Gracilibacillus salinarum TaxID=2932255 RepID=A0ABY4GV68_9BACI|nr:M23 family metallopeptidase [Gracilibacillus salinarum]UOQ87067.1 peptidoglycan DD-metalloendopeptidase family protein [Gracilibacillus salinarum]
MEENKNVSKNSWKRIFKKRWFFPAVYLAVAALLLTGVLWYQNAINQVPEAAEDMQDQLNGEQDSQDEEDATTVMQQQEMLEMPVAQDLQTEIVTKFYDYGADAETQEQALILHENQYYQSDGIDISTSGDEAFDVSAALSGEVVEVKQDPLLGNVVKLEHDFGVTTYYASLEEIFVEQGSTVEQGQAIATAGQNTLGQENGIHVHFEVRKDGTPVNPEDFVNQPINKIVAPDQDDAEADSETDTESDQGTEADDSEDKAPAAEEEDNTDDAEETPEDTEEDSTNNNESEMENSESSSAMENA